MSHLNRHTNIKMSLLKVGHLGESCFEYTVRVLIGARILTNTPELSECLCSAPYCK